MLLRQIVYDPDTKEITSNNPVAELAMGGVASGLETVCVLANKQAPLHSFYVIEDEHGKLHLPPTTRKKQRSIAPALAALTMLWHE